MLLFLGTMGVERLHAQTLLRGGCGYDVGDERELSQVARKMGVGDGRDVLHVAALWCLGLGPGTCSLSHKHKSACFPEAKANEAFQGS